MRDRPFISALFSAMLLIPISCSSPHPPVIRLSPHVQLPPASVAIFFVDGLDRTRLLQMVQSGECPNIHKYFVNGGVSVDSAMSSLPSITYCNSTSLITGCFPGHHGILGNKWFDPRTLEYKDYIHAGSYRAVNEDFSRRTLFEILDDHLTMNEQGHTRRGVSVTFDNEIPTAVDWFASHFSGVDHRVRHGIEDAIALAEREGRWPSVMMYYFPGVDEIGHRYDSDSRQYGEAVQVADESIGWICQSISDSALKERTYLVLISDHGHVAASRCKVFDLRDQLENALGLHLHQGPIARASYNGRLGLLADQDGVFVNCDSRGAMIHLRGSQGWGSPASVEEVDELLARSGVLGHPAVAVAITREGPNRIRLRSRRGEVCINRRVEGGVKLYRLSDNEGDPLGYATVGGAQEELIANWMESRKWLELTCRSELPDLVPQAMEMMDSPRAGDIVFFASDDWSFEGQSAGGHGSCERQDMNVPMYFTGPGLKAGAHVSCARLVDVMPTIVDFLGEAQRLTANDPIDGVSIAAELRAAQGP